MDHFFQLVIIILQSVIVFLTAYYLVKNFLDKEERKKMFDLKLANQNILTPIRLQAYERVILFLERINPSSLVMRSNKGVNALTLQTELLKTIRNEFEHNLSQQIYMSAVSWDALVKAKDETVKIINVAASKVAFDSTGMDLAQVVIQVSSQLTELPSKAAIDLIKKEIGKEF